ncbi:hypothetical protein DFJ74DRAFT_707828 [Hyaloraphidium curvatum]|nr:hypothetical protein DFJ74DRAFT_707828 [Hyaloraphidium curvatum]
MAAPLPPAQRPAAFAEAAALVLRRWTALQIALDNGLGAADAQTEFGELLGEVLGFFARNGADAHADVLADNFDAYFDDAFGVALEDGSAGQVARALGDLHRKIVGSGDASPLAALRESQDRVVGSQRAGSQLVAAQDEGLTVEDGSSSDDGEDSGDEDMEDAAPAAGPSAAPPRREKQERIIDEDGWETVQRKR